MLRMIVNRMSPLHWHCSSQVSVNCISVLDYSISNAGMQGIIFRYQLRYITNQEQDNKKMDGNYAQVLEDVRAAVECPVCLMVPRQVPIPMCPAGHVVCTLQEVQKTREGQVSYV